MGEVTVAAVQATPVFLDRDATIELVAARAKEAANQDAKLIVFPETFIPTYRIGSGAHPRGRAPSTSSWNGWWTNR